MILGRWQPDMVRISFAKKSCGLQLGLAELGHLRHGTTRGGPELPQPFSRPALVPGTPGLGQILVRCGLRVPAGIPRSLHGTGGPHRKVAALAGVDVPPSRPEQAQPRL